MARFNLIPRDERFFEEFVAMADHLRAGARLLEEMLSADPPVHAKAQEIKEIEHKGDFLTHEIIQRLHQTFITPIDREDIHSLSQRLDDVLDAIDDTAVLIPLYHIEKLRFGARELARAIAGQVDQIGLALKSLGKRKGIVERIVEVKRLEHEADLIHLKAVSQLYDDERDPILVMKWKEIFDFLEAATDRCEDVANLLENVVVKTR